MIMMMATEITKGKPVVYEFGPEARDACWSALTSSFHRFANIQQENIQHPMQGFCDSSQYDSQSDDVDTSHRSDSGSSDTFGLAYNSQTDTLPRNRENSSETTTTSEDAIDSSPPLDFCLVEHHRHRLGSLSVESRSAEIAFTEQLPPVMDGRTCDQIQCCPVDYSTPLLANRKSDQTNNDNNNNANYNNYLESTNVEVMPKPEHELEPENKPEFEHKLEPEYESELWSPPLDVELLADSRGPADVDGGECSDEGKKQQLVLPSSPEIQARMTRTPENLSSPSSSSKCMTSSLSDCSLSLSRYMSLSSECVSPFTINESTIVAEDEFKTFYESTLHVNGNADYELLKLIEHEMRIKEIDNNIVWYSKLFLGIVLFVLIRILF
ncbi:Hypothetical protein CINCED_3A018168 [Cinara cedri]|nr:Hypothetical protein CINCED_3A018168 [Cinara cedri]